MDDKILLAYEKHGIGKKDYDFMKMMTDWKMQNCLSILPNIKMSKIMEIGCASGMMLKEFDKRLAADMNIGLDMSVGSIELAKVEFPKSHYLVGDGKILPFKDKSIDLVIASDIIEHYEDPEEGLKEMQRISKYIMFKIPLEKCLKTVDDKYGEDHPSGHYFKWDKKGAIKLLKNSGLEIIDYRVDHPGENIRFYKERYLRYPFRKVLIKFEKTISRHFKNIYPFFYGSNLFVFCKS